MAKKPKGKTTMKSEPITAKHHDPCAMCGKLVRHIGKKYCSHDCYINTRRFTFERMVERFWERVQKDDGCWEWTGATSAAGYGVFGKNTKLWFAHRFSYELSNGPIPDGMFVCHQCDNPRCVRPDHLFLGSHKDNMKDMCLKGRQSKGEAHSRIIKRARHHAED